MNYFLNNNKIKMKYFVLSSKTAEKEEKFFGFRFEGKNFWKNKKNFEKIQKSQKKLDRNCTLIN